MERIDVESLIGVMPKIFSIIILVPINVIINGQLIGYILDLKDDNENYFTVSVPNILRIKIKGAKVFAGFASLFIVFVIVIIFFKDYAIKIFIEESNFTDNNIFAFLALATFISMVIGLIIALIKYFSLVHSSRVKNNSNTITSDEQIIKILLKGEDNNGEK